ncbi:hypothetical protein SNE40_015085 [Patella caerulea]|uniref:Uncharacterized protein n=1 Tax=Patella caerulea TaxID=87958 RepID=A0AAN8JLF9_PATCE
MSKVSAKCVPRNLNAQDRHKRVESSRELLDIYNASPDNVHARLATGDETWIHQWDPDTKQESINRSISILLHPRNSELSLQKEGARHVDCWSYASSWENAPVLKSRITQAALQCGFEQLNHPPIQSRSGPKLLRNLKSDLRGTRFGDDDELRAATGA